MAIVTVATFRDYLKAIADWANGLKEPRVQLSGRNVQPAITTFEPSLTDWTPGTNRMSPVVDLTAAPGVYAVAFALSCDQPIQVDGLVAPSGGTADMPSGNAAAIRFRVVLLPTSLASVAEYIPASRPIGGRYRLNLINRGDAVPTYCTLYTYHYSHAFPHPQNVRGLIARGLAIRDTVQHYTSTDPTNVYTFVRFAWGGGKVPIYVRSTLDQAVQVTVILRLGGISDLFNVGTKEVPAGGATVITNQDFAGIDVPSEMIDVRFQCATAPTSGQVDAWIDSLVGGSA